jgi:type VI protein secretion system component Hcp
MLGHSSRRGVAGTGRRPRVLGLAFPTAAALGAGAAVAVAAIPSADGTIHACYAPGGTSPGQLRVIDADTARCATGEETLTWSQQGPIGVQGATGAQGAPGVQGPPGVRGPAGEAGAQGEARPQGDAGGPPPSAPGAEPGSPGAAPGTETGATGPAADIFLRLDGIRGASSAAGRKGEIALRSFVFRARRGGAGGGSGGRARVDALRAIKAVDAASPRIVRAATGGRRIRRAVVRFIRPGDANAAFLTYTLTDVRIATYRHGGKDGDDRDLGPLEEELGLSAARVTVTQRTAGANGKRGPVVTVSWNLRPRRG